MVAAGAVLATSQPNGLWEAIPYYVAIVVAMRLERVTAVWVLGLTLDALGAVAGLGNQWGAALGTIAGALPWFLVMRQMRHMREQNLALEASQAAEARAAAALERSRLAREMHDVLAHTLSALALQLESTRLLAHDRGVGSDVSRAIDQAHGLAASGLEEARRAISTARGDALPGPERLRSLAQAVSEQSGLPVSVDVRGEPRELAAEARLAVYRTAQGSADQRPPARDPRSRRGGTRLPRRCDRAGSREPRHRRRRRRDKPAGHPDTRRRRLRTGRYARAS